jgi:hypothetical protein
MYYQKEVCTRWIILKLNEAKIAEHRGKVLDRFGYKKGYSHPKEVRLL